jgi:hypothetical protein
MGQAARQRVEAHFGLEALAGRLEAAFGALRGEPPGGGQTLR